MYMSDFYFNFSVALKLFFVWFLISMSFFIILKSDIVLSQSDVVTLIERGVINDDVLRKIYSQKEKSGEYGITLRKVKMAMV